MMLFVGGLGCNLDDYLGVGTFVCAVVMLCFVCFSVNFCDDFGCSLLAFVE